MASIADIIAFDGAATPVSHTFKPRSVAREGKRVTAVWREELANVPIAGCPRLVATTEDLPSGVMKMEVMAVVPVMETIGSQNASGYTAAPKVAHELTAKAIFYFSPRSTTSERRLLRQLLSNVIQGDNAAPTTPTTGQIPELVDLVAAPT